MKQILLLGATGRTGLQVLKYALEKGSLLMKSNWDWVITRPVSLNNNETLKTLVINYDKKPSPFNISRKQLAHFLVDCLETNVYIKKAAILSEK